MKICNLIVGINYEEDIIGAMVHDLKFYSTLCDISCKEHLLSFSLIGTEDDVLMGHAAMEKATSLTGYNCCLRVVLGDSDWYILETNESHYNRHVVIVLEGGEVIVKLFGSPYEIHQIYLGLLPLFNNKKNKGE